MREPGIPRTAYHYSGQGWEELPLSPPVEVTFRILVNGQELLTALCTPQKLDCLAVGYLYSDGFIDSTGDIASIHVDMENRTVDVKLQGREFQKPTQRIMTTGFGSGSIASEEVNAGAVPPDFRITPEEVLRLMDEMKARGTLYQHTGGIHASALCSGGQILVHAEDVGRHNTMDKVVGEYLMRGLSAPDLIMITTGRMSSEMVLKTARMGIPVIASLSAPTSKAVELAERYGIATVGYVGRDGLTVYSAAYRLRG
jgi:FdhD protein